MDATEYIKALGNSMGFVALQEWYYTHETNKFGKEKSYKQWQLGTIERFHYLQESVHG